MIDFTPLIEQECQRTIQTGYSRQELRELLTKYRIPFDPSSPVYRLQAIAKENNLPFSHTQTIFLPLSEKAKDWINRSINRILPYFPISSNHFEEIESHLEKNVRSDYLVDMIHAGRKAIVEGNIGDTEKFGKKIGIKYDPFSQCYVDGVLKMIIRDFVNLFGTEGKSTVQEAQINLSKDPSFYDMIHGHRSSQKSIITDMRREENKKLLDAIFLKYPNLKYYLRDIRDEDEDDEENVVIRKSPSPKKSPKPSPKKSPKPSPKKSPKPSPKKSPKPSPKKSPKPSPKKSPKPSPKRKKTMRRKQSTRKERKERKLQKSTRKERKERKQKSTQKERKERKQKSTRKERKERKERKQQKRKERKSQRKNKK